jgi:hypothetical protein
VAFKLAGSPEATEQLARMFEAQEQVKQKLADNGSPMSLVEGIAIKAPGRQPTGVQGEFFKVVRDPEASKYIGDWLMRHQAFDRNMTGGDPNQQEVA